MSYPGILAKNIKMRAWTWFRIRRQRAAFIHAICNWELFVIVFLSALFVCECNNNAGRPHTAVEDAIPIPPNWEPSDKVSYFHKRRLARTYFENAEFDRALQTWNKVDQLLPFSMAEEFYNLGIIYYADHKFSRAAKSFLEAVARNPEYIAAHIQLGNSYYRTGNITGARDHWSYAISLLNVSVRLDIPCVDRCAGHGFCMPNGTCECDPAWTGDHCEELRAEFREANSTNRDTTRWARRARLRWKGSQLSYTASSIANREVCSVLHRDPRFTQFIELSLNAVEYVAVDSDTPSAFSLPLGFPMDLVDLIAASAPSEFTDSPVDFEIVTGVTPLPSFDRENWPIDGRWIAWLDWEYVSPPRRWLPHIKRALDEVWTPSQWTRAGFTEKTDTGGAGMRDERVHVVPYGVDTNVFSPKSAAAAAAAVGPTLGIAAECLAKRHKLLFVGSTATRRGFGETLDTFVSLFAGGGNAIANGDVCLIVKETPHRTLAEADQSQHAAIKFYKSTMSGKALPPIEYIDRELSPQQMAALYSMATALIFPYKTEAFGIPLVEAAAVGVPIIAPNKGPAVELLPSDKYAYLVVSKIDQSKDKKALGEIEPLVSNTPRLLSVDRGSLEAELKLLLEEVNTTAVAKAEKARKRVEKHYKWTDVAQKVLDRVSELRGAPIHRYVPVRLDKALLEWAVIGDSNMKAPEFIKWLETRDVVLVHKL